MATEVEDCLACYAEGQLAGYFNKIPHMPCPWCSQSGKVHPDVNAAFRRVKKILPRAGQFCCAFGNGEAPVKLPKKIA